jgi:hypothetical protein
MGPKAPGFGCVLFQNVLRWFNRSWVCKRDARGRVTVRELDRKGTAKAGKEWQCLRKEQQYNGEDVYQEVFKDIWPQRTPEWWKDWKSLPLSGGVAQPAGRGILYGEGTFLCATNQRQNPGNYS